MKLWRYFGARQIKSRLFELENSEVIHIKTKPVDTTNKGTQFIAPTLFQLKTELG